MHHQLLPNVLRYESYRSGAVSLRVDNSTLAYLQAQVRQDLGRVWAWRPPTCGMQQP